MFCSNETPPVIFSILVTFTVSGVNAPFDTVIFLVDLPSGGVKSNPGAVTTNT